MAITTFATQVNKQGEEEVGSGPFVVVHPSRILCAGSEEYFG